MIHVIGNATIDTVIRLDRFPRPGETLVAKGAAHEDFGGKGANQAVAVARCGTAVRLAAAIGDDEAGRRIRAHLEAEGVAIDGLAEHAGPSDRCIIYVDRAGENTIVSLIAAATAFDPLAETGFARAIGAGDHVLLQGNLRPVVTQNCLVAAKRRGAVTVLNPSPTYQPAEYDWSIVDLAIVNRIEAIELGGADDPAQAAAALLKAGARDVVLTAGENGATWFARDATLHVDAPAVEAVDTVGAGDVFCGALVAALAAGRSRAFALRAATGAAAIAVTRPGVIAAFPSRDEMQHVFADAERASAPIKESVR